MEDEVIRVAEMSLLHLTACGEAGRNGKQIGRERGMCNVTGVEITSHQALMSPLITSEKQFF